MKVLEAKTSKVTQMMTSSFDRVENIVGKEENAGHQHFLHFQQCFQKVSSSCLLKVGKDVNLIVQLTFFNYGFIRHNKEVNLHQQFIKLC